MQAEACGLGLVQRGVTPTPRGPTQLGVEGGPSSSCQEKGHVQDAGTRAPYLQSWFCWRSFWLFVMWVTFNTGEAVDSVGISVVTVEVLALVILVGDS